MPSRQGVVVSAQSKHKSHAAPERAQASDWAPLQQLLPPDRCADFMFMGSVNGIFLYKHAGTRRYLNVDVFGACFAFNPTTSNYDPISTNVALLAVER